MSTSTPSPTPPSTATTNPPTTTTAATTTTPPPSSAPDPHLTAQARLAITAHLNSIGSSHLAPLSARATDIAANKKQIEQQEVTMAKEQEKLRREGDKGMKEVVRRGGELKELGDLQNWAEVLERDLRVVEQALSWGEGGEEGWETEEEEGAEGEGEGDGGGEGDDGEGAKGAEVAKGKGGEGERGKGGEGERRAEAVAA